MRVLLVANRGDDDPGYVGAALAPGAPRSCSPTASDAAALPDPAGFDVVVSLGSDWSVYWPRVADQVAGEAALLRARGRRRASRSWASASAARSSHTPSAGTVERAPEPEVGWFEVDSDVPELIPAGPYLQWHWDRFVAPPGQHRAGPQPRSARRRT